MIIKFIINIQLVLTLITVIVATIILYGE